MQGFHRENKLYLAEAKVEREPLQKLERYFKSDVVWMKTYAFSRLNRKKSRGGLKIEADEVKIKVKKSEDSLTKNLSFCLSKVR